MTSPVSHVSRDSSLRNTYVAMHVNLILLFKPALYSSTLVIKLFESSINLFYAEILTVTLLFYKLRNLHGTSTYKTKALRLVSNVQLVKWLLPCNGRQLRHYLALLW